MEPIIEEIDKSLLAEEIKGQVCLQELSRGKMQLYVLEGYKAPALMKEIGRLREIAFRTAGGGTGMSCDVDRYDLDSESGFRQLICWDSENCQVMGGYRILFGKDCRLDSNGQPEQILIHQALCDAHVGRRARCTLAGTHTVFC